ncbi:MAG: ribonuclease [Naasia sp.]|nr:ribonuclease [Naasia sp.]
MTPEPPGSPPPDAAHRARRAGEGEPGPYDGLVTITAAADGSALGNPGPAGWAWYIDDDRWAAGGWKHGTNNMGELKAVLELFRATAGTGEDLHVLCDSQYVINSVTKWMRGWKAKGWRKADGKPVLNVDLLQELDEAIAGRRYRFEWVKGHVGHVLNEAADARARAAATAFQQGTDVPTGPGFGAPLTLPARVAVPNPAPSAARVAPSAAQASLFDFDDAPLHEVSLQLTAEEYARLVQRARREGRSPEELLRDLI